MSSVTMFANCINSYYRVIIVPKKMAQINIFHFHIDTLLSRKSG